MIKNTINTGYFYDQNIYLPNIENTWEPVKLKLTGVPNGVKKVNHITYKYYISKNHSIVKNDEKLSTPVWFFKVSSTALLMVFICHHAQSLDSIFGENAVIVPLINLRLNFFQN